MPVWSLPNDNISINWLSDRVYKNAQIKHAENTNRFLEELGLQHQPSIPLFLCCLFLQMNVQQRAAILPNCLKQIGQNQTKHYLNSRPPCWIEKIPLIVGTAGVYDYSLAQALS